eukprot:CAMPEP_0203729110 /NCGR_PEP_ID=MMETSP0092-20131115/15862_1 /ASSEMBLY_ACC=CAM_ASM_001090 /TAXON_ID=426623 /ORGANISM="Chaetoceros affinis, Strain CCMP159" /LENGTH=69 /DNA_ID=CAMNT_0050611381 /DNA_START=47 /DNA_END=253 /DNA_ORIENTATION=-
MTLVGAEMKHQQDESIAMEHQSELASHLDDFRKTEGNEDENEEGLSPQEKYMKKWQVSDDTPEHIQVFE